VRSNEQLGLGYVAVREAAGTVVVIPDHIRKVLLAHLRIDHRDMLGRAGVDQRRTTIGGGSLEAGSKDDPGKLVGKFGEISAIEALQPTALLHEEHV
jgi:hypothetical protein